MVVIALSSGKGTLSSVSFLLLKNCTKIAPAFHFARFPPALCCNHKKRGGAVMFVRWNKNPAGRFVGDCAVRAVSLALRTTWEKAFEMLAENAFMMGDMPSSDSVWGATLRQHGFRREAIRNTCPDCYTVADFAEDHPRGTYVLKTDQHVTTVIDGDIFDSWDTSDEIPQYYWTK